MTRLLIIGGSGFIGRHLITRLKSSYEITSVSQSGFVKGVSNLQLELDDTDFGFVKGFDKIIYLGTVSSPKEAEIKPNEAFISNVVNIHRFLEVVRKQGVAKTILLSSAVLYSIENEGILTEESKIDPFMSIYNLCKYNMEILAKFYYEKYNMPISVFRLSNTYGPGQTNFRAPYLIPSLFEQALKNGKMEIWNTKPVRDWVYVDDVGSVVEKELVLPGGGLFNLGTGLGNSVGEVANIISELTGAKYVDLGKEVSPPYKVICNMMLLTKRLNFVPRTTLEYGLRETYKFFKNRFNE